MLGHHHEQHGNGQHRVDAGGLHGGFGGSGFGFWVDFNHTKRFLLVRPNDEPDIESHQKGNPHTDANGQGGWGEGECLDDVAVHPSNQNAGDDSGKGRVAEPKQGGGAITLPMAGFCSSGILGMEEIGRAHV